MDLAERRPNSAWIAAAGFAGAIASGYVMPASANRCSMLRAPLGIEDHTRSGQGYALTFDDGPHAQGTPAVLKVLSEDGTRATFFMVGEQVRRNPSLAREVADQGHEIALHCDRHRHLVRLAPWQVREDLARAIDSIESSTGRSPRLYRPPYGQLNIYALGLARRSGWRTLLWTHSGRDWESQATAESILARLTKGVRAGSVLLLHDADDYATHGSWRRTVQALPRVLDTLAQRGLRSTTP
jgi:peptidoglycan/xylan/chitin deacetylase (PgdA/CDA1 family)